MAAVDPKVDVANLFLLNASSPYQTLHSLSHVTTLLTTEIRRNFCSLFWYNLCVYSPTSSVMDMEIFLAS
jgi:hypothetical protein